TFACLPTASGLRASATESFCMGAILIETLNEMIVGACKPQVAGFRGTPRKPAAVARSLDANGADRDQKRSTGGVSVLWPAPRHLACDAATPPSQRRSRRRDRSQGQARRLRDRRRIEPESWPPKDVSVVHRDRVCGQGAGAIISAVEVAASARERSDLRES